MRKYSLASGCVAGSCCAAGTAGSATVVKSPSVNSALLQSERARFITLQNITTGRIKLSHHVMVRRYTAASVIKHCCKEDNMCHVEQSSERSVGRSLSLVVLLKTGSIRP